MDIQKLRKICSSMDKEELVNFAVNNRIRATNLKSEMIFYKNELNNIFKNIDKILDDHIDNCALELHTIIIHDNDNQYINQCLQEFNVIKKNIKMIRENIIEYKEEKINENKNIFN